MFLWRFLSKKSDIRYNIPIILTPQDISNILIIELKEAKELISSGLIERIPYLTNDRVFANRFMEYISSSPGSPSSLKEDF